MRYFLIRNLETLEVYLSEDMEEQPENSIPFFENNFQNPVFDCYPSPTSLVEGIISEQCVINKVYQILQENNLDYTLVDSKGNPKLPQ